MYGEELVTDWNRYFRLTTGQVSAWVWKGNVLWNFHPEEVVNYRAFNPTAKLVRSFPYRITAPDDAQFTSFSFLNFVYLVDRDGKLVAKWGVSDLLRKLFDCDFQTLSSETSTSEIDVWGSTWKVTTTTQIDPPLYELPVVNSIVALPSGTGFLFAGKNAVVWATHLTVRNARKRYPPPAS